MGEHVNNTLVLRRLDLDTLTWGTSETIYDDSFFVATLAADANGDPHAILATDGSQDVVYVYHDGNQWQSTPLDSLAVGNGRLVHPSLAIR